MTSLTLIKDSPSAHATLTATITVADDGTVGVELAYDKCPWNRPFRHRTDDPEALVAAKRAQYLADGFEEVTAS